MYISVLASANRQCWAQLTAAADEYFTASGVDRLSAKYWVLQARQHPTILTKQQKTPKMTIRLPGRWLPRQRPVDGKMEEQHSSSMTAPFLLRCLHR